MYPFVYLTISLLLESIQECGSVYWLAQFLVIRHFLMELQNPNPFFTMVTVYTYVQWKSRVRFYHLLCHLIYEGSLPKTVQDIYPTFLFTYQKLNHNPLCLFIRFLNTVERIAQETGKKYSLGTQADSQNQERGIHSDIITELLGFRYGSQTKKMEKFVKDGTREEGRGKSLTLKYFS